jgi:hypothetical protein
MVASPTLAVVRTNGPHAPSAPLPVVVSTTGSPYISASLASASVFSRSSVVSIDCTPIKSWFWLSMKSTAALSRVVGSR